ncbi:MAG: AMP-binding protein [Firmicutes bacterium]|nr:AMP-binding protein [Bacillota bacterium]
MDMKHESKRTANYFKLLGIKKGARVMLVLKRHYQFWFSIFALHKLGAIAIPATNQHQEHDYTYRFNAAGVSAIVCTADGDVDHQVGLAEKDSETLATKILVGGTHKIGSIGKPVPTYDVDIVDPNGKSVGIGKSGEIVIRTSEKNAVRSL